MKNNKRLLSLLVGLTLVLCMLPSMTFAADQYKCYVEHQGTIAVEARLGRNVTFTVNLDKAIVFYQGLYTVKPGSAEYKELSKNLSYEWFRDGEEDMVLGDGISYTHQTTKEDLDGREYVCRVSFNGKYAGKLYFVACKSVIKFVGSEKSFYYDQIDKEFKGTQKLLLSPKVVGEKHLHYEWWKYDRAQDDYVKLSDDSEYLATKYGDYIDYYYCYIYGKDTNCLTSNFVLISCEEVKIGQEISVPYNAETKSGYGNYGFAPDENGLYPIYLNSGENTDASIRIMDFDANIVQYKTEKDIDGRVSRVVAPFKANKKYEIVFDTTGPLSAVIGEKICDSSGERVSLTPKCTTCEGRGYIIDPDCELCEGSGDCPTCWGDGCCWFCGGSGECECLHALVPQKGCEWCGYTGNCPICGGSKTCDTCLGSCLCSCADKCLDCSGLGIIIITTSSFDAPVELLSARTSGNNAVKLSWNKIDGATEYVVYGQQCGKEYKKLATTTKTSYTVKKIAGKKLTAHKAYKFYVKAITANGAVKSKSIHFITGNTNGKYANAKSISINKKSLTLDVGETAKLKATTKIYKNKKHLSKKHGAATRYISDNPGVASVNSKGVVTAKGVGIANIYIQDIGGRYCKTSVTVQKETDRGAVTATEKISYVDENGEARKADCIIITSQSDYTLESGKWYAFTSDVKINNRIVNNANMNNPSRLILTDGHTLTASQGIENLAGKGIVIYGQSNGSGTLISDASSVDGCAGIGGNTATYVVGETSKSEAGVTTINGGTVIAKGDTFGAGIGGGYLGDCCAIFINGGKVTADGGIMAAGLGDGYNRNYGGIFDTQIDINGGTVTATGGMDSFGIKVGMGSIHIKDSMSIYAGDNLDTVKHCDANGIDRLCVYITPTKEYTVRHMWQNFDATEYMVRDREFLYGGAGMPTEAVAKNYEGFTAQPFEQRTISEEGRTVVEIKYNRNNYYVHFVPYKCTGPFPIIGRFGTDVTIDADDLSVEGYTFDGWFEDPACTRKFKLPATITMPAHDVILYAGWTKNSEN